MACVIRRVGSERGSIMTRIAILNSLNNESRFNPPQGDDRETMRALRERIGRKKAENTPEPSPAGNEIDECLTATYWG